MIFSKDLTLPDETSPEGNAYWIMNFVNQAMKKAYEVTGNKDFDQAHRDQYFTKATSGDYTNLRKVSQEILDKINNLQEPYEEA